MTRKDFELIAQVIDYRRAAISVLGKDTVKGRAESDAALRELDFVAWGMAGKLAETNPRFDRARFLAAAGVKS